MAVNGIEIEVGQVWRTREGGKMTVVGRPPSDVAACYTWHLTGPSEGSAPYYTDAGCYYSTTDRYYLDLVELISPAPAKELPVQFADANFVGVVRYDLADYEQAEAEKAKVDGLAAAHAEQSANATQVGGDHYKTQVIQPWDFIASNGIGFLAGNVVKYVARYKAKNGMEDLKKARHYLDKLIETEGGAA